MLYTKIRWKNFFSYGNVWTEIELNSNKSVNIIGKNGNGKSVLLDAFHFVCTGKLYRKRVNLPQAINTSNKKDCIVELEGITNNKKKFKVIRGLKPNIFKIEFDGKPLDESSHSLDFQSILEQMLNINPKALRFTNIISSSEYTPFLRMTPADKRIFIEDILAIEIISKILAILKRDYSILKQKILDNNSLIDKIQSNIDLIKEMNEKQSENNDEKIEQLYNKIRQIEKRIIEIKEENKKLEQQEIQVAKEINEFQKKTKEKISERDKIRSNLKKYKEQLDIQNKKYKENKQKGDQASWSVKGDIKRQNDDKTFFEENDECPTCKTELTVHYKKIQIANLDGEIKKLEDKLKKFDHGFQKLKKFKEKINNLQQKYDELFDKSTKIGQEVIKLEGTADSKVRDKIYKVQTQESNLKTIKEKNEEIDNINDEITELKKPKKKEIKSTKEKEQELNEAELERKKLNLSRKIYDYSFEILSDKGIKKYIVKKYVPLLNKYVNHFLEVFQTNYRLKFDDELNETIALKGYEKLSYYSMSMGERARADLSLLFAFLYVARAKQKVTSNVLILDEVADSNLDKDGLSGLVDIVNTLKTKGFTIFIISHRDELVNQFDETIRVEKKKFSKMLKD